MDKNKIIVYAPSSIAACASQSQHLDLLCSGFDVHDITTSSAFPYSPAANHQIHPDSTSAVSDALSHPLVHTASRPPSYLPTAGSSTSNPHAASRLIVQAEVSVRSSQTQVFSLRRHSLLLLFLTLQVSVGK